MSVLKTTCSRDCPDACSLLVTVEDGIATRLRGDPDDPVTQGFLCELVQAVETDQGGGTASYDEPVRLVPA